MKREKSIVALALVSLFLGALWFSASSLQAADMIQIKGSDSEVNLVQSLAEAFMKKNPGVNIAVTGGAGTGSPP